MLFDSGSSLVSPVTAASGILRIMAYFHRIFHEFVSEDSLSVSIILFDHRLDSGNFIRFI